MAEVSQQLRANQTMVEDNTMVFNESKMWDVIGANSGDEAIDPSSLNDSMNRINEKMEHLKAHIYEVIIKQYDEFCHAFKESVDLNGKLTSLIHDMNAFVATAREEVEPAASQTTVDYQDLQTSYIETESVINVLQQLCLIHENLTQCSACYQDQKYGEAAQCIQIVMNELSHIPMELCEKSVFKAVQANYVSSKSALVSSLEKNWSKIFVWQTQNPPSWDKAEGHLKTRLTIQTPFEGALEKTAAALDTLGILDFYLKLLAKKLFTYFMKPVMVFNKSLSVVSDKSAEEPSLQISMRKSTFGKKAHHMNAVEGYERQMIIVGFLRNHLKVIIATSSDEEEKKISLVGKIGGYVWKDLSSLIIEELLSASIPKTSSELEGYGQVVKMTEDFEECLQEAGFAPQGSTELSSYVRDINVQFSNKQCQDALVEARDLMTSEIHNMVVVQRQDDRASTKLDLNSGGKLTITEQALLSGKLEVEDDMLCAKTFHFPECRISQSTKDIMNLVYNTMIEAISATPAVAVQMFYSTRSIFELYVDVVPTYHRDSLKLPQLAAVYYNSCMYLAHHCVTLGHQFKQSLPEPINQGLVTYVDLVPVLRSCGTKCFMDVILSEKATLYEIISQCGAFAGEPKTVMEKAFKQVIHQLLRLGKVWRDVLPSNVYEKSVGQLIDSVLRKITSEILKLEDISAEDALLLHSLFNSVIAKAPEILAPSSFFDSTADWEFHSFIPSWNRFCELANVMEASLQEIADRWQDKQGSLFQAFDSSELRILIKALFQNTDRRANVLAMIRK